MIKLICVSCLLGVTTLVAAQSPSIHVPVGKKFQVIMETTSSTTVTVMGQAIDNVMDLKSTQDYTLKAIRPTGYTLTVIPKRIVGSVRVMGREEKFDTDDEATKNSPAAAALNSIGKASDIDIDSGKVHMTGETANMMNSILGASDLPGDGLGFFFQSPKPTIHQGDSWSDSVVTDKMHIVLQYVITSITPQQIEVRITSDTKMEMSMKQGGADVQASMKSFSTATRLYDKNTGLLISEKRASESSGTAETMGISAPMTVKASMLMTVN